MLWQWPAERTHGEGAAYGRRRNGGFAKRTPELDGFITDFHQRHGIDLDWVYVAKMLYGVVTLAERGEFNPDTMIVAVITGPAQPAATP